MTATLEVILTPAEFGPLRERDLSQTVCVVFDILRATTTMITALANGADSIIPVEQIGATASLLTVVGGKVVYAADVFSSAK